MARGHGEFALLCIIAACGIVVSRHVDNRRAADVIFNGPNFRAGQIVGTINIHDLNEASGLAASRKHPGTLYSHNDHGGGPEIFAISTTGQLQAVFTISGATSNDWEDIAVGKCAQGSSEYCIYFGDTGDGGHGAVNNVFRIPEPDSLTDQTIKVADADKLEFRWDQQDCETLMVDPDANVYIISKLTGAHGTIARLPTSAWGSGQRVDVSSSARLSLTSTHHDPIAGDISPDGNEVLIKIHEELYYWNMQGSRDYQAILQTPGTKVPYTRIEQDESVCWDIQGNGYYITSEGRNKPLYYYGRN